MSPRTTRSAVDVHGYALRVIREARGRSVSDLASTLPGKTGTGVDRSYITHLENGTKRTVSPEFYAALLRELQIDDYRALLAVAPERAA
jgi:transcriptional regulator with XRE-family HTH domain